MDLRELPGTPGLRHPWEQERFRYFHQLLRATGSLEGAEAILDVGAGDGWFARSLLQRHPARRVVCWDQAYQPDSRARLGLEDARLELVSRRPDLPFDLVLALDVVEHVEDDQEFLADLVAHTLAPLGRMLITVPAWQGLMSRHDQLLGHYRRYAPRALHALAARCGLTILRHGNLFHSLLVPRAMAVARERLVPRRAHQAEPSLQWNHGPLVTRAVAGALRLDSAICSRLAWAGAPALPGLSTWVLCRR